MNLVYVGVGANLGDREASIRAATSRLERLPSVRALRLSALRETPPWGVEEQPPFLNGVVELETDATPQALLESLLAIERDLGRVRDGSRWGPRTIDLDVLVFGDLVVDEPGLTVPHPRLAERRFALEPLAELAPELVVPGLGRVADLLADLDGPLEPGGSGRTMAP